MNSKLPEKQDNGLFGKIKNFFKKLFSKADDNYKEKLEVQPNIEKEDISKKQFEDSIKVEVNNDYVKEMKREKILDELDANPKLLYDLSIEKLKKLEIYYEESIKKQEEKLAKLKNAG